MALLAAWSVALTIPEGRAGDAALAPLATLSIGIPFVTVPTLLLSVLAWPLRGLPVLAFRAVVFLLAALPLVCFWEPNQLVLIAPVQAAYAVLVGHPKEWTW